MSVGTTSARWKLDVIDERLWDGECANKLTPKGKPSVAMVLLSHIDVLYRLER